MAVQHSDTKALEIWAREIASSGTGMTPGSFSVLFWKSGKQNYKSTKVCFVGMTLGFFLMLNLEILNTYQRNLVLRNFESAFARI
jgi:hypothetical protein